MILSLLAWKSTRLINEEFYSKLLSEKTFISRSIFLIGIYLCIFIGYKNVASRKSTALILSTKEYFTYNRDLWAWKMYWRKINLLLIIKSKIKTSKKIIIAELDFLQTLKWSFTCTAKQIFFLSSLPILFFFMIFSSAAKWNLIS